MFSTFILLLPHLAVLPGLDAGRDVVEPASGSSKTVRPRASGGTRYMGDAVRTWFVQGRRTRNLVKGLELGLLLLVGVLF